VLYLLPAEQRVACAGAGSLWWSYVLAPSYKAEHLNLLMQLDDYLGEEGLYDYIVGFRMSFNAIGFEKFDIPGVRDFGSYPGRWMIPTAVDAQSLVSVTSALREDYRFDVLEHIIESLCKRGTDLLLE